MWGTIQEVEEVDANEPARDQPLSAYCTQQGNPPFVYFGGDKEITGRVYGITIEAEREWRGTPPLNRFLTGNRRETKEIGIIILGGLERDETPAVNRDGLLSTVLFLGQFDDRIHCLPLT